MKIVRQSLINVFFSVQAKLDGVTNLIGCACDSNSRNTGFLDNNFDLSEDEIEENGQNPLCLESQYYFFDGHYITIQGLEYLDKDFDNVTESKEIRQALEILIGDKNLDKFFYGDKGKKKPRKEW